MSLPVLLAPAFLLGLALLPVALGLRARARPPSRALAGLTFLARGAGRLPSSWRTRLRHLPLGLGVAGLALALLALARPVVPEEVPLAERGLDILLVLDVSSSMRSRDMDPERTRLEVAKDAAADFVAGRPRDRIGLTTFARYADLRSPPTRDHQALAGILAAVEAVPSDSAEDATGIGTAVAHAAKVLAGGGARGGVVILLTDGEENVALHGARGEIAPVQAAQLSARLGVRVYAIAAGVGRRDAEGAWVPIDTEPLKEVARRTGGTFHAAPDAQSVASVYRRIDALEQTPFEETTTVLRDVYAPFLLAAVLLLLTGLLLRATLFRTRPGDGSRVRRWGPPLAVLLLLGLALTGPSFGDDEDDAAWGGVDLVLLLDVSRSMLAQDVDPSRLERAKHDVRQLAERAVGDRLGLVAFAGDARLVVPLTRDRAALADLADGVDPTVAGRGGTDLGLAIAAGVKALERAEQAGPQLVLLTDGEDLEGAGLVAAERAKDRGVTLHAVGYGSPRGSKIAVEEDGRETFLRDRSGGDVVSASDPTGLERLTAATGGAYVHADATPDALTELYDRHVLPGAKLVRRATSRRPADHYRIPLALACVVGLLWLARWPRPRGGVAGTVLAALLLLGGCDATQAGREAWEREAWAEAHDAFARAAAAAGEDASSELLYDLAVAALRVEAWDEAQGAARRIETRGDAAWKGRAAFVRGNVSFALSLAAEAAMDATSGDARARLEAVAHAEDALAAWQTAAASRDDWPEARRNVERGLRRLEALRETKGDRRPPPPRPPPPPPPPPRSEQPEETEPPRVISREMPPERVLELLERLKKKEQEKRRVRQRERRVRGEAVERDW